MSDFLAGLFDPSGFTPHRYCGGWTDGLIWLHNISDLLIWLAYMAIPAVLLYFVARRRDLPFPGVFLMFGAFIVTCGFTHLLEVVTFYTPLYRLSGLVKLVTAIVSLATVAVLIPVAPRVLRLRSPQELEREVHERQQVEEQLRALSAELEKQVDERTRANEALRREVAERIRAEERLQHVSQDLAASNRELEQFAYIASHDLQEPLRMVASYTQLLGRRYRGKLDADADEFIGFAVDGATRMQRLINDLLAYSRVTTHSQLLTVADVGAAFTEAVANLRATIAESEAVVSAGALPSVLADRSQLVQLLQNLIGNAIKFRGQQPPEVRIEAEDRGGEWLFSVRDNGIGIDRQYAERVFVLFKRLHSQAEYPGTGIGLAICKRIVERCGGRIWVESQPGQGCTFYFTLPRPKEDSHDHGTA